jgi:hypothetical protein
MGVGYVVRSPNTRTTTAMTMTMRPNATDARTVTRRAAELRGSGNRNWSRILPNWRLCALWTYEVPCQGVQRRRPSLRAPSR